MCGIVGIISSKHQDNLKHDLKNMMAVLRHRGPDGEGVWQDDQITLGHLRLSIHDLSCHGYQPMVSHCQRFVVTFNGEIYNYKLLSQHLLKNFNWLAKTNCDTEVLVNLFTYYSIDEAIEKCHGMFAFALWDRKERKCYLARDRFGEKPLYYARVGQDIIFASELKSLRAYEGWSSEISLEATKQFLQYSYIHQPLSIYKDCFKLESGYYLLILPDRTIEKKQYYDAVLKALESKADVLDIGFEEASQLLEGELSRVVKQQMSADVPLGAFLSGGVDSSLICALMQGKSFEKINTFSIGFEESGFNEAPHAKEVAHHLGCKHTELYVTAEKSQSIIPQLMSIYDEPFADSSQIPTLIVSKLTKQDVTVALTGDAGDELFGGYNRYFYRINKLVNNPSFLYVMKNEKIVNLMASIYKFVSLFVPKKYRISDFQKKLEKLRFIASNCTDYLAYYRQLVSHVKDVSAYINCQGAMCENHLFKDYFQLSDIEKMMLFDTLSYLNSSILTKVDRSAMNYSLETRVPFLDHGIYELAWKIPLQHKIGKKQGKAILKDILYRHVPKSLLDRPKKGFSVPLNFWLRNNLKPWACDLLSVSNINRYGILNAKACQGALNDFFETGYESSKIWNLLMFQSWCEENN